MQYHVKIYYTMTPRALEPPAGSSYSARAQVVPAFITSVTDLFEIDRLTREQRSYTYIISGLQPDAGGIYRHSSDNRYMYGAEAASMNIIDIPLGGDRSPAERGMDGRFTWEPDYIGRMLFPHTEPEPIFIGESLAGPNTPVGGTGANAGRINGYLASFVANTMLTLTVQQQRVAIQEHIDSGFDSELEVIPEFATLRTGWKVSPNAAHLTNMAAGESPGGGSSSQGSGSKYPETNMNVNISLPMIDLTPGTADGGPGARSGTSVGVSFFDFVTFTVSETQIALTFGIPLLYKEKKNEGDEWKKWSSGDGAAMNQINNANIMTVNNFANPDGFMNRSSSIQIPSLDAIEKSLDKPFSPKKKSKKFEVTLDLQFAFIFRYNSIDNKFYFSQATISVKGKLKFKYNARFVKFPPLYMYIKVEVSLELKTGLTVVRDPVETGRINSLTAVHLKKGEEISFTTDSRNFHIAFNGEISISSTIPNGTTGKFKSNGKKPLTFTMLNQSGEKLSQVHTITIKAEKDTYFSHAATLGGTESAVLWNGMVLTPKIYFEIGAGLGVEILKVELFFHASIKLTMTFGPRSREFDFITAEWYTHKGAFKVNEFKLQAGIGFRIVLIFFSIENDFVTYTLKYCGDKNQWSHGFTFFDRNNDKEKELWPIGARSLLFEESGPTMRMPGSTATTQRTFAPEFYNDFDFMDGLGRMAVPFASMTSCEDTPFQVSGSRTDGDAFRLADGLFLGYDYRVVTAGGENYLVYTYGRDPEAVNPVDNTRLYMSKIMYNSDTGTYGVVHPNAGKTAQDGDPFLTPFMLLTESRIPVDEASLSGDLTFDVWVEDDTYVHVAWVSYAEVSDPVPVRLDEPAASPPAGMELGNYDDIGFMPLEPAYVPEPIEPVEPIAPVAPDIFAFGIDDGDYDADDPAFDDYRLFVFESLLGTTTERWMNPYHYAEFGLLVSIFTAEAEDYLEEMDIYGEDLIEYIAALATRAAYEVEYAVYEEALEVYMEWYLFFLSWFNHNAYIQFLATSSAKNTEVRTARFAIYDDDGFSPSRVVAEMSVDPSDPRHKYMPKGAGDGSVIFYASAVMKDRAWLDDITGDFDSFLLTVHPNEGVGDNDPIDAGSRNIRAFRRMSQRAVWEIYGNRSRIYATFTNDGSKSYFTLAEGQIVDSLAVMLENGRYYVSYITSEYALLNNNTEFCIIRRLYLQTFDPDTGEWGRVFLLRTLRDYDEGCEIDWNCPNHSCLVHTGGRMCPDGVYTGSTYDPATGTYTRGTQIQFYENPFFANLQFLHGKLAPMELWSCHRDYCGHNPCIPEAFNPRMPHIGPLPESFMLFDMNGSTFIIPYAELNNIIETAGGFIFPFFEPEQIWDEDGNDITETTTGRSNVTIGADGAGNISAVYIESVPGTTSNAVYITKYCPITGTWGVGTMLAMHNMQVYEDSFRKGWTFEETELAYLGLLDGYQTYFNNGSFSGNQSFRFQSLQLALGRPQVICDDTGDIIDEGTLLVITQGALTYLVIEDTPEGMVVLPDRSEEALAGIYAISFGVGGKSIGEDIIEFRTLDFSAGSTLDTALRFINTGDVPIRGEHGKPITVELRLYTPTASPDAGLLAAWHINSNILAGQEVILADTLLPLSATVPAGSYFYITVAEDSGLGNPFTGSTLILRDDSVVNGTYRVEAGPDLGFEGFSLSASGINSFGHMTVNVDITISNRGTERADNVYIQFSHQNGRDSETGWLIYTPVDITGADLTTGIPVRIAPAMMMTAFTADNRINGEYLLVDENNTSHIDPNYSRRVRGTITLPPSAFCEITESLVIRVDIYSDADERANFGPGMIRLHGSREQNKSNNTRMATFEHTTRFITSSRIVLTPGSTMRLPVRINTTTGNAAPVILVDEIPNSVDEEKNLGILSFVPGGYVGTGSMTGTLLIAPATTEPVSGRIHIKDVNTNSIHIISYRTRDFGEGIDIFRDNGYFTFYNRTGDRYDESAHPPSQSWRFASHVMTWGLDADGDVIQDNPPLNNHLAAADQGSWFEFTTVASEFELFFQGTVEISSDVLLRPIILTLPNDKGGIFSTMVNGFPDNPYNLPYTVTVKVLSQEAVFDRIIEHYTDEVPLPQRDDSAPYILWSRNFPEPGALRNGEELEISAYVISKNALSAVIFNGVNQPVEEGARFLRYDTSIHRCVSAHQTLDGDEPCGGVYLHFNGVCNDADCRLIHGSLLSVSAFNMAGNRDISSTFVNWFGEEDDRLGTAPALNAYFTINDETAPFIQNGARSIRASDRVYIRADADYDDGPIAFVTVTRIDFDDYGTILRGAPLTEAEPGRYAIYINGFYEILVQAENGTWSRVIIEMTQMDDNVPVVTMNLILTNAVGLMFSGSSDTPPDTAIEWIARKNPTPGSLHINGISSVEINGFNVFESHAGVRTAGGIFPIEFSGMYTLTAADTVGNTVSPSLNVQNVPINVSNPEIAVTGNAWRQGRDNGTVTVTTDLIRGGRYDEARSEPELNLYFGSYEHLILTLEEAPLLNIEDWLENMLADASAWSLGDKVYEALTPGEYMLIVRDAHEQDNVSVIAHKYFEIFDTAVDFDAVARRMTEDFEVEVNAWGGRDFVGIYEFAIIPTADDSLVPISEIEGFGGEWIVSEFPANWEMLFEGLHAAVYQVAVRELAVPSDDYNLLTDKNIILNEAADRVKAAANNAVPGAVDIAAGEYIQLASTYLYLWKDYDSADAEARYMQLINGDPVILSLMDVWQAAILISEAAAEAAKAAYDAALWDFARAIIVYDVNAELSAALAALAAAEAEYNAKLTVVSAISANTYQTDGELWDNAKTGILQAISDIGVARLEINSAFIPGRIPSTGMNVTFSGSGLRMSDRITFTINGSTVTLNPNSSAQFVWSGALPTAVAIGSLFSIEVFVNGNRINLNMVDIILDGGRLLTGRSRNEITLRNVELGLVGRHHTVIPPSGSATHVSGGGSVAITSAAFDDADFAFSVIDGGGSPTHVLTGLRPVRGELGSVTMESFSESIYLTGVEYDAIQIYNTEGDISNRPVWLEEPWVAALIEETAQNDGLPVNNVFILIGTENGIVQIIPSYIPSVNGGPIMGTGSRIRFAVPCGDGLFNIMEEIIIVIPGDITGTGSVSGFDVGLALNAHLGLMTVPLKDYQILAANVADGVFTGFISGFDVGLMLNYHLLLLNEFPVMSD
jgi:hypothetical protein